MTRALLQPVGQLRELRVRQTPLRAARTVQDAGEQERMGETNSRRVHHYNAGTLGRRDGVLEAERTHKPERRLCRTSQHNEQVTRPLRQARDPLRHHRLQTRRQALRPMLHQRAPQLERIERIAPRAVNDSPYRRAR